MKSLVNIGAVVGLACVMAVGLVACGPQDAASDQGVSAAQEAAQTSVATSGEGAQTTSADGAECPADDIQMQVVGSNAVGHVAIPASWSPFNDIDVDSPTMVQYTSDGATILTLEVFDAADLGELPDDTTPSLAYANMLYYSLANDVGEENVVGATVELDDRPAYQVYGIFDDGTYLVMWTIDDDAGMVRYVSAEGTEQTILELVEFVEATYTLA